MNEDTLKFNEALYRGSKQVIKQNINTEYKGNPEDKLKIFKKLEQKYEKAKTLSLQKIGQKKLLYYAIFGANYIPLLELSLKSLINCKQNKSFDLLLILDESTLNLLKTVKQLEEFEWDYYLVPTPADGVEASKLKVNIFDYPNINKYDKILYLDVDIICKGDITNIFDYDSQDKLEVVEAPIMTWSSTVFPNIIKSATLSHSLSFFTEKDKAYILKNNPSVFNAGQFYLKNTEQMKEHFNNIKWLMEVWPSAYFFEQSFMNQYFNFNKLTSYNILNNSVSITTTLFDLRFTPIKDVPKQHKDEHSLIHFAGTPTNGHNKFKFINYYCNYFNICL